MGNDGWKDVSLGEIFNVKHGFAFKGEFFTDEPKTTIVVTPGNFAIGGGFQNPKPKFYDGPIPEEYVLKPGQIIVTMTDLSKQSDTLGYAAIVPDDGNTWLHNQRIGLLEFKESCPSDPIFVNYLLRTHKYRSWIIGSASGTTVKHTSPSRIHSYKCKIPPLPEQHAIACILGALDDKIELNRRMNQTLEAMARAIFKSWFVDFDPVRAKAEGQQPPGLAPHIADLFPDSFQESERGEIPDGWTIRELGDVADVNWGDTNVTKKSYVEDGFIAYSAKGPDGFLPYHDYDRIGVVLSAIGANSGYTWLALGKWSCIKNTIRFWSTDETLSTEYLFHATHGNHHWPLRGSAQPFISQGDARKVRILKPARDLGKLFGEVVRPFHEKVYRSSIENNTLAALRDTLLPRLISGELRVPDAERIVGRAL